MTVPDEILRHVMRRWPSGVCVVSSILGDSRHGMTVNSFTSISVKSCPDYNYNDEHHTNLPHGCIVWYFWNHCPFG